MPERWTGRGPLRAAEPLWAWTLLAACYLASCWATIVGRTQWGPDSRLYLAWTYRWLGRSEAASAHLSRDFLYGRDGVGTCPRLCWPPGYEHLWFTGPDAAVVGARPLYPLLSAPFVAAVGPWGMLVVPFVGFTAALLGVVLLGHRLGGRHWGLLAGLGLLAAVTVSRWALMGQTEGLAIGLTVVTLLVLPLRRATRRRDVLVFAALLLANLMVRQFAVALTAGVALAWLWATVRGRRVVNPWAPFAALAVPLTVAVLAVQQWLTGRLYGGGVDLATRYRDTVRALFDVDAGPASVPHVLAYFGARDYAVVRTDLPLAATIGLGLLALVWRWRSELSALTVGLLGVTLALCVVVVYPAYYRYFAPVHAALLLSAVALLADLSARPRRRPSRAVESAPPPSPALVPLPPARRIPRLGWALVGGLLAVSVLLTQRSAAREAWRHSPVAVVAGALLLALAVAVTTRLVDRRFGVGPAVAAGATLALCRLVVAAAERDLAVAVVVAGAAVAAALLLRRSGPRRAALPLAAFGAAVLAAASAAPQGVAVVGGVAAAAVAARLRARSGGDPAGPGATGREPAGPSGRRRPDTSWLWYVAVAGAAGLLGVGVRWWRTGAPLGDLAAGRRPLDALVAGEFRQLVLDRVLYLLVLVALVGVVVCWRRVEAWLALGTLVPAALLEWADPTGIGDLMVAVPGLLLVAVALLAPRFADTAPAADPPAGRAVRPGAVLTG